MVKEISPANLITINYIKISDSAMLVLKYCLQLDQLLKNRTNGLFDLYLALHVTETSYL